MIEEANKNQGEFYEAAIVFSGVKIICKAIVENDRSKTNKVIYKN